MRPVEESSRGRAPFHWTMRASIVCVFLSWSLANPVSAQEDPLRPISSLVRRYDDEGALARIRELPAGVQRRARTRYLRGRLLARLGRLEEAAAAFPTGEDASALPEAIQRDATRRASLAWTRTGHCDRARELVSELSADPLVEARLAECALSDEDLEEAVEQLRAVVRRRASEVDLFAVRFALAEALARSGEREEAITVLTRLTIERAEHPEIESARRALTELNGGPVELSFAQRMSQAERLTRVRRHADAIAILDALGRPRRQTELRRYLHVRGMALYRERHHYADAAAVLRESARLRGAHAAADAFHAARALSRADRDAEAVRAYRRFARTHSSHPRAAEASYLAAWLEIRHGTRGGERNMRRFSRSRLATPALVRAATWQLGLRAFERGAFRAAEGHFSRYAQTSSASLVRARGLYWLGRARQSRGATSAAEAYREALHVEPLHWYALLARQRLEELGEDVPAPFPSEAEEGEGESVTIELPELVRFYAELGLRTDARDAMRRAERSVRAGPGRTRRLVAMYQELGEANRLVRLAGGATTTRRRHTPGPSDRWRWAAAYPRPWEADATVAATRVGLTASHLYAVMRQESGFNPDVVSYADAIGLMQLLPETAARVAEPLGIDVSRAALFDPVTNLRLGAAYVGGLAERFGVPLAFAAYNAGGHRVQSWLEESGRTELDLWVEHIPFEQTRNYIRRVTTHLAHYRYLEDPEAGWPIALPTHVAPSD